MAFRILIVGCGDIGSRIAQRHLARGDAVTAVVRRPEAAEALQAQGMTPLLAELDRHWQPPAADAIYWCAPPPASGHDDPRLAAALAQLPPPPQGLLYISTTGVYGDCQGRWIDEAEPLKPQSARGQRRLAAELHLRAWAARTAARSLALRVPGIYGPGRLPVERLKKATPILAGAESPFTNRIHADDLADAALLTLERGISGGAYHVSDGSPTTMSDYFLQCAALLGLPEPPQLGLREARAQLTPALLSFLDESKRLRTERIQALGFVPHYANLAEGLKSCI